MALIMLVGLLAVGPSQIPTPSAEAASAPFLSPAQSHGEVWRLYAAYFLREPDRGGLEYWTRQRGAGRPLREVSEHFARSSEFASRYGQLDNARFVERVYRNVMDREPDAGGRQYWLGRLGRGMTRGSLMLHFSESPEFKRSTAAAVERSRLSRGSGGSGGSEDTSSGALASVPSNVDVNRWLIDPWDPNPDHGYPAFRTFCQFSHLGFYDPIVAPGNDRFMHLHMFFGHQGADHDSTYQSLRSSGNSTCDGGPLNRTAYWMPAVFDHQDRVVIPDSFELYYKAENANRASDVRTYPNGLRMIAGSPMGGSTAGAGLTWGWRCGSREASPSWRIPDCGGERLTAWVRFPYCWDGRNLDSADHRSHMAYGTNNTWGPCPTSHPIHLPELTEFAHFQNPSGSGQWYLSSDRMNPSNPAPNGSTFHADWFGAWDNTIQDRWVTNCLHGVRSASNGNLCDGQQLRPAVTYGGPHRISGWAPTP